METNRQIPAWMQEASVKDIPRKKLEFLQKLVFESKSLSQKELLPFLMALAQRSRAENISFSAVETTAIVDAIRKYSTPEELLKMNQIMKLMEKRKQ